MISIMGTVGAGKSTLCKYFVEATNIKLFPEPVETNPYLTKFYEEPSSYAFQMQCFLLLQRFKQMQQAQYMDEYLMDMGMWGNDIFAKLMWTNLDITDVDYETYLDLSNSLKQLVRPPHLTVYLHCRPEVAVGRILKRGRPSELNASNKYWYDLYNEYEAWYRSYDAGGKIRIDVSDLDIVNNPVHRQEVIDIINSSYVIEHH